MIILQNCNVYVNCNQMEAGEMHEFKPLNDTVGGKRQPWKGKKVKTMRLSKAYNVIEGGKSKRGARVWYCGAELAFDDNPDTGKKTLKSAQFCRDRLCPMCNWRRSIKTFFQLSKIMDVAQDENPNAESVFLTLTVRNCSGAELASTLDLMFSAWNKLNKHRRFTQAGFLGYFRALEVTYNRDANTYHPHFHVILLVDKQYFYAPTKYLHTKDWSRLWGVSLGVDYLPVCDIRAVKTHKERKYKAIAEVAKYTVKDSDYLYNDEELTTRIVGELSHALKGRRLFAFGGVIKEIKRRLLLDDNENGDLVNVTEDAPMREDIASQWQWYTWDFGLRDYFRQS